MINFFTGLLTEQQEYAVRNLLERLQALLATATKKRPLNPPNLLIGKSGKANGQITSAAEEKAKLKQVIHSLKNWQVYIDFAIKE
jgi:hypothetical protein